MAFGFPAYAEAVECYDGCSRGELLDALDDALEALNWRADYLGLSSLTARVRMNYWSWGERLTIAVSDEILHVRSECVLPTQCLDWGKNQRNVEQLFLLLAEILNPRTGGQCVPRRGEKPHEQGIYPAHIRGVRGSVPYRPATPPAPSSVDPRPRPRNGTDGSRPDSAAVRPSGPRDQE
jgi:hypothetical protein